MLQALFATATRRGGSLIFVGNTPLSRADPLHRVSAGAALFFPFLLREFFAEQVSGVKLLEWGWGRECGGIGTVSFVEKLSGIPRVITGGAVVKDPLAAAGAALDP